jgi:hypothetical protein
MTLSSEQAAQALHDVENVLNRSGELYRYQRTAPMLMLWGVIWLIGFALTDFYPRYANSVWIVLDVVGTVGCFLLGRRGHDEASRKDKWRWLISIGSIFAFYFATLVILQPATGQQSAALIALLVALIYVLCGVWRGTRLAVIGAALAALTLVGYFMIPVHFFLWMAVIGGGALMLAGVWLRKA